MKSQYTKGLMNDLHECCRIIAHTADDPVRSLQTLLAMCVNVYEHPDDERYRHIRLSNDRFHRRVWDVPGGRDACDRLGWVETVQHDGEPCVILPWNEKVPGAVCKYLRLAIEDALSDTEADYDDDAEADYDDDAEADYDDDAEETPAPPSSPMGYRNESSLRTIDDVAPLPSRDAAEPESQLERMRRAREEERQRFATLLSVDKTSAAPPPPPPPPSSSPPPTPTGHRYASSLQGSEEIIFASRETPEPGSPRDRYLRELEETRRAREAERERVATLLANDQRCEVPPWCITATHRAFPLTRSRRHSFENIPSDAIHDETPRRTRAFVTTDGARHRSPPPPPRRRSRERSETDSERVSSRVSNSTQGARGVAA